MLALIAALSRNYVIGNKGIIPWRIPGEQRRFKELTTGKTVIMGKRSFEEIGKPLPNRKTIVISNTSNYEYENCITLGSLVEAIAYVGDDDAFVSGGEQLYREALPLVDVMYLTMIDLEIEGDTYFPRFIEEDFELVEEEDNQGEIPYKYRTYVRKIKTNSPPLNSEVKMPYEYIGKRDMVAIRFATPEDAKQLCIWWNDGQVMAHAGYPNGLNTTTEAIQEQINSEDKNRRRLILEIEGKPVGEMSYRLFDSTAEIGIKICDITYQEKGYGTTALQLLIDYLFMVIKVSKIILDTNLKNTRAQHVYEKIGFTKTAIHNEAWKDQLGQLQSFIDYELGKENYY
jgi:dihydrofolate reductase/RimJ/RimL family protein N-acetyltransferase